MFLAGITRNALEADKDNQSVDFTLTSERRMKCSRGKSATAIMSEAFCGCYGDTNLTVIRPGRLKGAIVGRLTDSKQAARFDAKHILRNRSRIYALGRSQSTRSCR